MGVVYQARQPHLNRIVALKMILSVTHASEADLARFLVEAGAVAQLQHPNTVQLYESGQHEGLPAVLHAGACSASSLSAQGPWERLTAGGAATQIRTMASALAEASLWPSGLKTAA